MPNAVERLTAINFNVKTVFPVSLNFSGNLSFVRLVMLPSRSATVVQYNLTGLIVEFTAKIYRAAGGGIGGIYQRYCRSD
jgi:hypothetical protein